MRQEKSGIPRRNVLKTIAVGATAGGLGALGKPVAAQDGLADWLSNVGNADGVVDRTGQDEVTVEVGSQANGGAFGFGPAVVRIDPGTRVVWEWTGEGTPHNVVATDGAFESDLISEAGATFEYTPEGNDVLRYVCTPHESMGMKGALVVGDVDVSVGGSEGDGDGGADAQTGGKDSGGAGGDGGSEATAGPFDYGGWFEDVSNFEGTVDRTGQEKVTVQVGAGENALAFDPPAIQIDPGTRVVWEWTGEGGQHNVVVQDHDVESPLQEEEGATYALDFDGTGIVKYVCAPHEAAGMKGAVVVGEPTQATGVDWLRTGLVGLAGGIVAAPFVASEVLARRREDEEKRGPERTAD